MKSFLTFLLFVALGAAGVYYWMTTDDYEQKVKYEEWSSDFTSSQLRDRQKELESLVSKTEAKLDNIIPENALDEQAAEQKQDGSSSEYIRELKKTVKTKADLATYRQSLKQLIEKEREKQLALSQRVEAQIAANIKLFEERRTKAYREFEKRFAADNSRMEGNKGPRYARGKRELDAKAKEYLDTVTAQNEKWRAGVASSLEQSKLFIRQIEGQIIKVDELIDRSTLTEENQHALDTSIETLARKATDLQKVQINDDTLKRDSLAYELSSYKTELDDISRQLNSNASDHQEIMGELKRDYDAAIMEMAIYSVAAIFIILLLMFAWSLVSRFFN